MRNVVPVPTKIILIIVASVSVWISARRKSLGQANQVSRRKSFERLATQANMP